MESLLVILMLESSGTCLEAMRLFLVIYLTQSRKSHQLHHPKNFFGNYSLLNLDLTSLKLHVARCLVCFPACRINKRNLVPLEAHLLDREMLNSDRSYMLDCSTEIFIWMGMTTLVSERKSSVTVLEVSR